MSAYRLETFAPAAGGAARAEPVERRLEAARRGAITGYLAGGDGTALPRRGGRLTSELVEAIADARVTNEAARRHVAQSLAPMVEALRRAVAPALADAGLGPRSPAWSSARCAQSRARPRRAALGVAGRIAALLGLRPRHGRSRRRSSSRARRRCSGTRATTISISTPASRRSAPASPRI
jgi:hypothetical protein